MWQEYRKLPVKFLNFGLQLGHMSYLPVVAPSYRIYSTVHKLTVRLNARLVASFRDTYSSS